ncbi:MAG: methyltransferase domain-containing protein [Theionarchaea archaeon]|nr:methyltransferase domain-containing protein [Theionarchaea archaeon]
MSGQELHTTEEWIRLLEEQADYTREYRFNLYKKVNIESKKKILDVGCGPGIVTADIASLTDGYIVGIDIDDKKLVYAQTIIPDHVDLTKANVLELPFGDNTFDLVVFSVVLPYIRDQQKAVDEMARVTQKGGIVLATGEPDYAGALYYPENKAVSPSLKYYEERGFDIRTGRKLKYLFRKAGLETEIGVCDHMLRFVNKDAQEQLKDYLDHFPESKQILMKMGWTEKQIEDYKLESVDLIQNGLSFSFVPAFCAIGRK